MAVGVLEALVDVGNAATLYLVAIVMLGVAFGTRAAVGAAVASFLLYDVLFVAPRFTLAVEDPREWLDLVLFLFVGITIGQVSAAEARPRADAATRPRSGGALRIESSAGHRTLSG